MPAAAAAVGLLTVLVTGCTEDDSGESLTVVVPGAGEVVSVPFEVTIDSSVPLGPQDAGLHHVHIWFGQDEALQTIGEGEVVQIHNAPGGEHDMTVSLRNPDHTFAGVETTVRIVISAAPTG